MVLSLMIEEPRLLKVTHHNLVHPTLAGLSSTSGSTEATGMQIIRRSLKGADIPPAVTNVIMHSWRHSTHKQYDHYIAKWV